MKSSVQVTQSGRLLNEKQAAELLGMSVAWMRKRRLLKEPPAAIRLGAAVRYRVADIEAFVESLAVPVHPREAQ